MDFTVTGFSQEKGIRRFLFRGVFEDRTTQEFTVDADITLLRKYGIALQELPLLCRRLLEKDHHAQEGRVFIFTEELMREHAAQCTAVLRAAQERKKTYRRPASTRVGQHWRGPQ